MAEVTDTEKIAVGNELEKLFAVHDRPLPTAKKAILVQELVNTGFPIKAISAGIRKLMLEDLKHITLLTVIASAREFLAGDNAIEPCTFCNGAGTVTGYDDAKYRFALACICPNGGRRVESQHLVRWTGEGTQLSRGRLLVMQVDFAMA